MHQKFQRINPQILGDAQKIIQMLLDRHLIEISSSPWSSRLLFVQKAAEEKQQKHKDVHFIPGEKIREPIKRKLRMVIDMRHLNMRLKLINTQWNVPSIWSLLSDFHDAKFVSILDLNSGFWHFPLSERAKPLTAFNFNDITYHCTRMPQGLRISSSVMQQKMSKWILKYQLTID